MDKTREKAKDTTKDMTKDTTKNMTKDKKDRKVLLRIEHLKQYFPVKKSSVFSTERLYVRANDDISLSIYEGETFGLVGESGCGKSTLGRSLLQLYQQTDGRTIYYGRDVDELAPKYVMHILSHLPEERRKLEGQKKKEAEAEKHYESLPDGKEKQESWLGYRNAQKAARDTFLDIVQLIGGFFVAEDLTPISEILVKEYQEGVAVRRLKDRINMDRLELAGLESTLTDKGKSEAEIRKDTADSRKAIEQKESKLVKKEAALQEVRDRIYKMLEPYRSHPDFEKYEAYRDKGINLTKLTEEEMRTLRKDLQLIFQDPYSSLNPRMTVGQIITEGLLAHKMFHRSDKKLQDYVMDTMEKCGLAPYFVHRYPHQFSGGQRQRIGIARSIALNPKFIVCDEAVSALDVSIQSQIINLLLDLKEKHNLTYLFISHDLSVIKYISDRVGVMYLGNIVELAETKELYDAPMHPYTEALLSAIPTTDLEEKRKDVILEGDIPSPIHPPTGCKFHTRCRYATEVCSKVDPEMEEARPGHFVACHHRLNQGNG